MTEQAFGQEGVEKSLGYTPALVDMPASDERGGDISLQETELRDAADEISKARNERQREIESRPVDAAVEVQDTAGRHLPDHNTLTAEEASHLVTNARTQQENTAELDERAALAAEIDALRNGTTTEQLLNEQPPVFDQQQQPQAQPVLSDHERMAKVLQDNPALLAAVNQTVAQEQARAEQAYQQAAAVIQQNAHVAAAALVSNFPELQSLQPHEIGTAIQVLGQRDPQRAQQIVNFIDRIAPLVNQAVRVQEQQQQRTYAAYHQWQANQQAQWQQTTHAADQAFDKWAEQQGATRADREAMVPEVMSMLRESGMSDQDIAYQYQNGPMRSLQGQQILWMAAKYRASQRGARSKLSRPVPAVQRPGSPVARIPDGDIHLGRLEAKLDREMSPKAAAELVVARRAARRS
jgi:hypothetical protein